MDASAAIANMPPDMPSPMPSVDPSAPSAAPRWLTRERLVAYCAALLACQLILLAMWGVAHYVMQLRHVPPLGIDYRVYWSASYVTLHDGALAAFDRLHLLAAEAQVMRMDMTHTPYAPWVYPPVFQLVIYPLALLPYLASYALFSLTGMAGCFAVCARAVKAGAVPWVVMLAFPGLWTAVLCGQNSLLTLALAGGALMLLERRPALAGVCAGLLVIKPQLAVLLPLALLCGRHWRALAAAAITGAVFCLVSGWVFGLPVWLRFFEMLPRFNGIMVENGTDLWRAMPTVFSLARRAGADVPLAYAVHAAIAVPAVALALLLWVRRVRLELRAAAIVLATLLAQPYLVYYDLAWLILPILFLCVDRVRHGEWSAFGRVAIVLAWFVPLQGFLAVMLPSMGQWGPAVILMLLAVVLQRAWRAWHVPLCAVVAV